LEALAAINLGVVRHKHVCKVNAPMRNLGGVSETSRSTLRYQREAHFV